jgi:hypothetical protein
MEKKILVLPLGCALFAFTAFAQTTNDSASGMPQSGTNQSSDVTSGQQTDSNQTGGMSDQSTQAQPSIPQSDTNTPGTSNQSAADQTGAAPMSNTATIEGCVVSQGSDYYLQSENGAPIRLSGSDVGSYVGRKIRVHGAEANTSDSNTNKTDNGVNASSGSQNSDMSASNGESQSADNPNNSAAVSGNSESTSSNDPASSATSNGLESQAFQVDRIEVLSSACPAADMTQHQPNQGDQQPQ